MVLRMASCAHDAVSEVPSARWDVRDALPAVDEPIASRMRHGAFVWACELIDNVAFGISAAESAAMDPQQRLLLEHGYSALHNAALDRPRLAAAWRVSSLVSRLQTWSTCWCPQVQAVALRVAFTLQQAQASRLRGRLCMCWGCMGHASHMTQPAPHHWSLATRGCVDSNAMSAH